ncbi:uncharacterized protein TRUGW13939_03419 [Talaromyces rugulosus]|uniref:cutinase n=1 Tax=Talaromyces rugulosus TaxID=121627 RepID=A0A7H8QR04_TALRU|nr:uncharacterized protein TRUGW13939_03419 [Talaromyces rugulosus]QKX56318.1 hypothetical protein TRUGW13939_03419 [Talaromyces rugulosus]
MLFLVEIFLLSLFVLGALASRVPESDILSFTKRNTPLNEFLSILIANTPAVNVSLTESTSVITTLDKLLAISTGAQTIYNELEGSCQEWTVIFARGTAEPGNVGVLVGPPLFDALGDQFGSSSIAIQGVNGYSASVEDYLAGGDPAGSAEMANQIETARSKCPNTKLIVAGYSQGCQIVHNAIAKLAATTTTWISSVLLFGDPDDGELLPNIPASKTFTACHDGDDICKNGLFILPAHLTYAENVTEAAQFAADVASA